MFPFRTLRMGIEPPELLREQYLPCGFIRIGRMQALHIHTDVGCPANRQYDIVSGMGKIEIRNCMVDGDFAAGLRTGGLRLEKRFLLQTVGEMRRRFRNSIKGGEYRIQHKPCREAADPVLRTPQTEILPAAFCGQPAETRQLIGDFRGHPLKKVPAFIGFQIINRSHEESIAQPGPEENAEERCKSYGCRLYAKSYAKAMRTKAMQKFHETHEKHK